VRSGPASNLYAQVPTASGLTAFAHCSRPASFVGLGLIESFMAWHSRSVAEPQRKPFASFFNLRYVAALASSLSLSALPTALQAFALYLFEVTVLRL